MCQAATSTSWRASKQNTNGNATAIRHAMIATMKQLQSDTMVRSKQNQTKNGLCV